MTKRFLMQFMHEEEAQALSEYGIVLAIVAVGLIAGVVALRTQIAQWFSVLNQSLTNHTPTAQ